MKKENIRIFAGAIAGAIAVSTLSLVLSNTNPFKRDVIETYAVTTTKYEIESLKEKNNDVSVTENYKEYLTKKQCNNLATIALTEDEITKKPYSISFETNTIDYDDIRLRLQNNSENLTDWTLFAMFTGIGVLWGGSGVWCVNDFIRIKKEIEKDKEKVKVKGLQN